MKMLCRIFPKEKSFTQELIEQYVDGEDGIKVTIEKRFKKNEEIAGQDIDAEMQALRERYYEASSTVQNGEDGVAIMLVGYLGELNREGNSPKTLAAFAGLSKEKERTDDAADDRAVGDADSVKPEPEAPEAPAPLGKLARGSLGTAAAAAGFGTLAAATASPDRDAPRKEDGQKKYLTFKRVATVAFCGLVATFLGYAAYKGKIPLVHKFGRNL